MRNKYYVLEVQRFDHNESNEHSGSMGKSIHIGYMNKVFNTKRDACEYYDKYNPHMRSLNAVESYRSDWDPYTRLMYVVRDYCYEYLTISSFEN
jgi:hypothetical protein|tara:strand:+ start:2272 stop:2553 length:282 start_codon:yes stop_codon:yes gene_type:complete